MVLPNGTLLQGGKYKIVRFISRGGFGCTYVAEHTMLHKYVAVKEFFVKDFCNRDTASMHVTLGTLSMKSLVDKLRGKFIDEAVGLSQLDHPGIVKVQDVFDENGTAYYVMDFIDGQSLADMVKSQGPLPEAQALGYIRQVCDALGYVHAHNRLHLDIKPANIMVDSRDQAILIDFGVSKQYDESEGENTSTLIGKTPGFAPIEQMGNDVVHFMPATDIYAVGATLYYLLTAKTPLSANLLAGGEELEPMPRHLSPMVCNAVWQAMKTRKLDRPQSVEAFLSLLGAPSQMPMGYAASSVPTQVVSPNPGIPYSGASQGATNVVPRAQDASGVPPKAGAPTIVDSRVGAPTQVAPAPSSSPVYYDEDKPSFFSKYKVPIIALCAVLLLGIILLWPKKGKEKIVDDGYEIVDTRSAKEFDGPALPSEEAVAPEEAAEPEGSEIVEEKEEVAEPIVEEPLDDSPSTAPLDGNVGVDDLSKSAAREEVIVAEPKPSSDMVYNTDNLERQPSFPGGQAAMYQWLGANLNYPPAAAEEGVSGRVIVQFVVSASGDIRDAKISRGQHPALDNEALRLVKSMPKWTPGYKDGHPVAVSYVLPINFRIN